MSNEETDNTIQIDCNYRDQKLHFTLPQDTTLQDLARECADTIEAEVERLSFLISPKPGLKKYPFPATPLSQLIGDKTKIKLIGTPSADLKESENLAARVAARNQARQGARQAARQVKHAPNRDWRKVQDEATYTFHSIEPLNYLPNPAKSKRYLERLANDPGIKASMRKHQFSVGLLTEMNPAEHTTHESKTLGLNRNRGEVIELRLRTDSYDGYRDYKVIRKTLCHELAHNVFSEHDRDFWDLTKKIEVEVERNDHSHGGHSVGGQEFYNADDDYVDGDHMDGGGWEGGEFVLGGASSGQQGLSRREIIARATMSRIEKQKEVEKAAEQDQSMK